MGNKKLIMVSGVGRTGTTIVDLLLGNHPDAFSLGEVFAYFRPMRTHHFHIECVCGKDPCPVWSRIRHFDEKHFHEKVFEELDVQFLIDSSKDRNWVIDANRRGKGRPYEVINFLMYKDMEDYLYSQWKRKRQWRKPFVNYYTKFFKANIPFYSVSFNRFRENPVGFLNAVEKITGMPYQKGNESIRDFPNYHMLFGSAGVRRQLEAHKVSIQSNTEFPDDFQQVLQEMLQEVNADKKVSEIYQILRKRDILLNQNLSAPQKKRMRKFWYDYAAIIKQKIMKHHPQPWTVYGPVKDDK